MKQMLGTTLALTLVSAIGMAGTASAQTVKGTAAIGITQPATKVVGKEVVTTMKIKNMSKGPIAGLKVEEYWYDKGGDPSPGGSQLLKEPLAAGAVVSVELRTPRTDKMDRNTYQFSHANGQVTVKVFAKLQ